MQSKTTTKGGRKGTAGGSKGKARGKAERLRPRNEREQRLVDETLEHAEEIRLARAQTDARAASVSPHLSDEEKEAEQFKADALRYAQKAYTAALNHFEKFHANPLALSRLAVVYGDEKPGDLHIIVTLPGVINKAVSEAEAYEAVKDAELLARTLEHPDCPEAFKSAFGAIYTEHILDGSEVDWTTPAAVRVMLPLALLRQWEYHDGSGITPTDILVTLSSSSVLVGDELSEAVRASLLNAMEGGAK